MHLHSLHVFLFQMGGPWRLGRSVGCSVSVEFYQAVIFGSLWVMMLIILMVAEGHVLVHPSADIPKCFPLTIR